MPARPRHLLALLAALCLAGGCGGAFDEARADDDGAGAGGGDDGPPAPGGGAPEAEECVTAADCVPAASTCCDCPTFAVPAESGYDEACGEVGCEPPGSCPLVEATCTAGRCELVCAPLVTDRLCEHGFAVDSFGCLLDECAATPDPDSAGGECVEDADCAQVPADCCGCERGGSDTAVPASRVEQHIDELDCPADPACPGVDVCEPDAMPMCVAGSCHLVGPDSGGGAPGATLCGTPDTGACAGGTVCVLNHAEANEATALGVGTCQSP